MRVLIAAHYFLPHPGGVEYEALEQARRLTQRGHQVTVVTSAIPDGQPHTREGGFDVRRVRANNFLERKFGVPYPLFSPSLFKTMTELARQHDVVLAHSHTFLTSVAAASAARKTKTPLLVVQNNPYIHYGFPLNWVQDSADALLGKYTLRSASRLLAISHFTADYVRRLVPEKRVDVLYLGADTSRFTPVSAEEKLRIRQRLGLPETGFIAFTVRRLFYRNGVDILMRASVLLKDHADTHIVVGGKGRDRPLMEQFIREHSLTNVRLVGYIPDELLADYFRAADAFVLPTRTGEGFGLVIVEAAACGVPSIATRSGAPEELIEHGKTGLLVPPDSPEALAEAILALRDQPEQRLSMGRAARELAERLDWEHSIDQLENQLQAIIRPA